HVDGPGDGEDRAEDERGDVEGAEGAVRRANEGDAEEIVEERPEDRAGPAESDLRGAYIEGGPVRPRGLRGPPGLPDRAGRARGLHRRFDADPGTRSGGRRRLRDRLAESRPARGAHWCVRG